MHAPSGVALRGRLPAFGTIPVRRRDHQIRPGLNLWDEHLALLSYKVANGTNLLCMLLTRYPREEAGGFRVPGWASDAGPSQEGGQRARSAGSPADKGPTPDAVELLQYLGSEPGLVVSGGPPGVEEVARTPSVVSWASEDARRVPRLTGGGVGPISRATSRVHRVSGRSAGLGLPAAACVHCGSQQTPRWWREISPDGVLCNACGIWLKRHGYPRPVQYFAEVVGSGSPAAAAALLSPPLGSGAAATPQAGGAVGGVTPPGPGPAHMLTSRDEELDSLDQVTASPSRRLAGAREASAEYYFINGRPKRRRGGAQAGSTQTASTGRATGDDSASGEERGVEGMQRAMTRRHEPALQSLDPGTPLFVLRRRLLKRGDGAVAAALLRVGWEPGSRPLHTIFHAFTRAADECQVEDFEVLTDSSASILLTPLPGGPPIDDAAIQRMLDRL